MRKRFKCGCFSTGLIKRRGKAAAYDTKAMFALVRLILVKQKCGARRRRRFSVFKLSELWPLKVVRETSRLVGVQRKL